MKKLVLAIAIVAVLAMAFTSVGYAYTASTENSGNSVTSQYVTLTQQNYTFNGNAVSFDVIETEAGIKYQLNGRTVSLVDIEGQAYIGTLIGSDKLSATMTGGPGGVLDVAVTTPPIGLGFTDYSGDLYGWRYVLKATADFTDTKTVEQVNGISTPAVGTCYKVSDPGTINAGSLTVAADDVIGFDGTAWVLIPAQYAYYSGSANGMWIVKGQSIESDYHVAAVDADAGGYIKLYEADTIKDITVVVITHDNLGNPSVHDVYLNKGITEPIDLGESPTGEWFVDGRKLTDGKYTVEEADTDGGCNVVIYDKKCTSGTYTVVKIDASKPLNSRVNLVPGQTAGQAVTGVESWNCGGGIKLHILTGVTYTTQLYFAGAGGNVNTSLRSEGVNIKATTQITIMPEWVPAGASDRLKYTLSAGQQGVGDRVVYVESGSNVILPDNCFDAPTGKVFVGWKADNMSKIFTSGHIYTGYTAERTFTAQWASALNNECFTITFNAGGGYGNMDDAYLLKNMESGNTYTLPPCEYTKPGCRALGWRVVGDSGTVYAACADKFVDIPGVKEDLTLTALWEEAPVGGEDVAISFDHNTVIVLPTQTGNAPQDPYVLHGKSIGERINLAQGTWYVKGRSLGDVNGYTLKDSDVLHGGYIVLYQDIPAASKYSVIKVEGNWVEVTENLAVDDTVDHVGGWMVNGAAVYGGMYVVEAHDADSAYSRFIVLYEFTNPNDEYTAIMVPTEGNPTMMKGLHEGDTVPNTASWHVKGGNGLAADYEVDPDDAVNGFIVIYQTANQDNKYTVIKAGVNGATAIRNLTAGDINNAVTGVKGWKVCGWEIGIYKVRAEDATRADATTLGSSGYILIYGNAAADYVYHSGENGSYTLPYCYYAPPEDPAMLNFKGWKLLGWDVMSIPGRNAGQSYTMPIGTDGYIVKNGMIKFSYSNDLHNGEAA